VADAVCPPADGRFIVEQVAGAEYVEFDGAHLASIEAGEAFGERVLTFLQA
jgi:3-oxoadipate enol-lactonase